MSVDGEMCSTPFSSIWNTLVGQTVDRSLYPDLSYCGAAFCNLSWDYHIFHDFTMLSEKDHYFGQSCSSVACLQNHPISCFPTVFEVDAGDCIADDDPCQYGCVLLWLCSCIQPRSSVTSATLLQGAPQRNLVSVPALLGRRANVLSGFSSKVSFLRSVGIKKSGFSVRSESWAAFRETSMVYRNVVALVWAWGMVAIEGLILTPSFEKLPYSGTTALQFPIYMWDTISSPLYGQWHTRTS